MRARLARTIVALAARTLGTRHADWAQAMKAELDVAIHDGRPMSFAAGCLLASWRQMLRFPEGRLTLVSHLLAIGLIVPLAALWLWLGLLGYPYLAIGNVGVWGFIEGRSEQIPLLLVGEWSLAPALTMVILLQSVGQLLLAWFLLERDWPRVSSVARFNAATLTTLLLVTSMIAVVGYGVLFGITALITETLAVLALAWWHDHMPQASAMERTA
jgi:hypothetical protein